MLGGDAAVTTLLIMLTATARAATFEAGSICAGINASTPADQMLAGKHLRLLNMEWAPWFSATAAGTGYEGYDVDMLDAISQSLGFTLEWVDIGYPADGVTWDEHLAAWLYQGDLIGGWWNPSQARLYGSDYIFLKGHVDVSPTLVTKMQQAQQQSLANSMSSFMKPFSNALWIMLIGLVLISGLVDFSIERLKTKETRLTTSLYEYAAGFLWGGWEYPLSKTSAIYQVILGFIVLVVVSTYTANLAAFITVAAKPSMAVSSMDDARINLKRTCISESAARSQIDALYPTQSYAGSHKTWAGPEEILASGAICDASVISAQLYSEWQMDPSSCRRIALAETLFPAKGSLITNRASPCVALAIEAGVHELTVSGRLQRLKSKWFPAATCAASGAADTDTADDAAAARRQLRPKLPRGRPELSETWSSVRGSHARQLKGGSGSDFGDGDLPEGVQPMGLIDFAGLLVLWGAVSAAAVIWSVGTYVYSGCSPNKQKSVGASDVVLDDEKAMLREVLRVVSALQAQKSEDDHVAPAPPTAESAGGQADLMAA